MPRILAGVLFGAVIGCGSSQDPKPQDHQQIALEQMKKREEALTAELNSLRAEVKDLQARAGEKAQRIMEIVAEPVQRRQPAKGKITRIEPEDATLIEINLGVDHGVRTGQTLAVQRPDVETLYLGTIRVLQVLPTRAIARLVQTNPLKKETIKVGDEVAMR